MSRMILLLVLSFIALPRFAQAQQGFNTSTDQYRRLNAPVQDNLRSRAVAINEGPMQVMVDLRAAGSDLTSFTVMSRHAKVHMAVLKGAYTGASAARSAQMLGIIGSSNSPLVGQASIISPMINRLYFSLSTEDVELQLSALMAMAMITNANPSLAITSSGSSMTLQDWTLNQFYKIITNDDKPFPLRRAAVMAISSIQSEAAVRKMSQCITKLVADAGDGEDEVFDITDSGMEDKGESGKSLIAALMLGFEDQLDGAGSQRALTMLNYYAQLNTEDRSCKRQWYGSVPIGLLMPRGNDYINTTTLLMGRYSMARMSLPSPTGGGHGGRYVYSRMDETTNDYGRTFRRETGTAACLIPVIEDDDFRCSTRKAFNEMYNDIAFPSGQLSDADNPPVGPVNFDGCLRARTNKIMFELGKELLLGGGIADIAVTGIIKLGARGIRLMSINRAYKVLRLTGSARQASRYANIAGAVGQYEEALLKIYGWYDMEGDIEGWANDIRND